MLEQNYDFLVSNLSGKRDDIGKFEEKLNENLIQRLLYSDINQKIQILHKSPNKKVLLIKPKYDQPRKPKMIVKLQVGINSIELRNGILFYTGRHEFCIAFIKYLESKKCIYTICRSK